MTNQSITLSIPDDLYTRAEQIAAAKGQLIEKVLLEHLRTLSTPASPLDELDALRAAPNHHRLLLENERLRVIETRIEAGDRTPIHTHNWPGILYILSWSRFIRYDDKDNIILESWKVAALQNPPPVVWSAALPPHWLENVGDQPLHLIGVELKPGG
jgi:hypothetical protein